MLQTILGKGGCGPSDEPVCTSTLVSVFRGLGIEEQTARRGITRGAVKVDRAGRRGRSTPTGAAPGTGAGSAPTAGAVTRSDAAGVAVVTGAAHGIGRAITLRLAAHG